MYIYIYIQSFIEGSVEVKLRTIWTDGKAEVGRVRKEQKREDKRRERLRRKRMQVRQKLVVAKHCVFPEGRNVGSLKTTT